MMFKVVMNVTYGCVSSFASRRDLIYGEIYLPWLALAHHTEYSTLPRGLEIDWPRLKRIARLVNLLCVIEGIMNSGI